MLAFRFDCYLQLHFQQSQKVTKKIITEKYDRKESQKNVTDIYDRKYHRKNHRKNYRKTHKKNHRKLSRPGPCSVVIAHLWHCCCCKEETFFGDCLTLNGIVLLSLDLIFSVGTSSCHFRFLFVFETFSPTHQIYMCSVRNCHRGTGASDFDIHHFPLECQCQCQWNAKCQCLWDFKKGQPLAEWFWL